MACGRGAVGGKRNPEVHVVGTVTAAGCHLLATPTAPGPWPSGPPVVCMSCVLLLAEGQRAFGVPTIEPPSTWAILLSIPPPPTMQSECNRRIVLCGLIPLLSSL